ncbi:hypothetical protein [Undibacterium sp.]|jgi:hypothetical protein|uniref:hypothetical protein n=1 Tax=Undibacterium sp. TaxID=1914977 RepID=UPI002B9D4CD5|nr:hypothetical protein [Undibacterium sp.]HTD06974.1 hypothetical protein [Undibacterium sp.]
MKFTSEHMRLADTVKQSVANGSNSCLNAWEEAEELPSHPLFKNQGVPGLPGKFV